MISDEDLQRALIAATGAFQWLSAQDLSNTVEVRRAANGWIITVCRIGANSPIERRERVCADIDQLRLALTNMLSEWETANQEDAQATETLAQMQDARKLQL